MTSPFFFSSRFFSRSLPFKLSPLLPGCFRHVFGERPWKIQSCSRSWLGQSYFSFPLAPTSVRNPHPPSPHISRFRSSSSRLSPLFFRCLLSHAFLSYSPRLILARGASCENQPLWSTCSPAKRLSFSPVVLKRPLLVAFPPPFPTVSSTIL